MARFSALSKRNFPPSPQKHHERFPNRIDYCVSPLAALSFAVLEPDASFGPKNSIKKPG
ncbi:MAG: hypothetical protein Q4C95_08105 [Planctomycetia bacterium]|nr:hypothetical protein [Planctomycetia bacterium]